MDLRNTLILFEGADSESFFAGSGLDPSATQPLLHEFTYGRDAVSSQTTVRLEFLQLLERSYGSIRWNLGLSVYPYVGHLLCSPACGVSDCHLRNPRPPVSSIIERPFLGLPLLSFYSCNVLSDQPGFHRMSERHRKYRSQTRLSSSGLLHEFWSNLGQVRKCKDFFQCCDRSEILVKCAWRNDFGLKPLVEPFPGVQGNRSTGESET